MCGAITTLVLAAACATTDAAKEARHAARIQVLQKELLARGDADSLAAGALFARLSASPDGSLELAARAVAAAPDRADLLLEQLQLCQKIPACDSQALEAQLRQLDPDNGISWTYALWRADRSNDQAELRRDRAGLARAQRVDWHWNEIVSRLTAAVTGKAGYGSQEALVEVIGIEAAFITPLQSVSKACSAQEIQAPEVLAQCRQIAAAFRRGDTYLFEMYGTSLAARLWPAGSAESAQIAVERRAVHYWMDAHSRHSAELDSAAAARILATLYAQYPTEQQAFRALFIRLGLNPDPPADWVDHYPGS
jgi:hypothetical protein